MQKLNYSNKTFNLIQRFAVEKLHELCHNRSLDSYRARTLNPKSALDELYKVLNDWKKNKIKDFSTVKSCIDESISLLKIDDSLHYGHTSKKSFIELLGSVKDQKHLHEIDKCEHSIYYILNSNKDYVSLLLDRLNTLLEHLPKEKSERAVLLMKLDLYLGHFVTEIINIGYSKSYILKLLQAIFVYDAIGDFSKSWDKFSDIFISGKKSNYYVVFTLNGSKSQIENLPISELKDTVNLAILGNSPSKKVSNYVQSRPTRKFITFQVEAFDYYQALKLAKSNMSLILDKIHLGYSNLKLVIRDTALVISEEHPEKGDLQPIHYQIDGYYKSNQELYKDFLIKLDKIESKEYVSKEVTERVQSALRYLRLGNESIELEKKFVNYWIGLEFVFSSYNIQESTFQRLKKHLITSHAVHYVKRNLMQFHHDIKTYNLEDSMDGFNNDLSYLLNSNNLDILISDFEDRPLLSYRCSKIKSHLLQASDKRSNYLDNHKKHLEWHLIRIYRVRNELIHDAAIIENIENLTGNLRYFLSFILNKLIEYFNECSPKPDSERLVVMNDFFLNQEMIWKNIKDEKYNIEKMIRVPFVFDYLF